MFRNYIKVALRNLLKRKGYSLINILGLATGMAVCLLIVLFIQSELSYDQHHAKGDNVYRIVLERKYPGRATSYAIIPQSIGPTMKGEFPEIEECVRIFNFAGNGNFFLRIGEKRFEEGRVLSADSNFFKIFSSNFLAGSATDALMKPNSVVVNETTAKKYYGSASGALGQTFETDGPNNQPLVWNITAVVADWPDNSHFLFDLLISVNSFPFTRQPNFINFATNTYFLLNPQADPKALEAKFPAYLNKYVAGEVSRQFGQSFEDFQKAGNGYRYYLQPMKKIHLISDLEAELRPNGSLSAVYIFGVIAVFILALACINFINLSTARSVERAKEVGIRKTFGSEKKALIYQFLLESIVVCLVSIIVAIVLIFLLLPLFNQVSGKQLTATYFLTPDKIGLLFLFSVIVGLIAGLYPAFILSSFKPILVLKGRFRSNRFGLALRNGLVVFQFAISVVLIISTIMVNRQMNYMLSEKLGFRKDQIITIERTDLLDEQTTAFKTELARIPGVESVTGNSGIPGGQTFFGITFQPVGAKQPMTGRGIIVDDQYAKTLNLEMKEGRFFSNSFSTDSLAVVLNEKAVAEMQLQPPVLGTRLTTPDGFLNAPDGSQYQYTVVGVVKDFHYQSLHQNISPLVMMNTKKFQDQSGLVTLGIKGKNFEDAITGIENTWKKFVPETPFHYSFLDQSLAAQYASEKTLQRVFTIFSTLAIFIACIGLLGLAAYTTQQRTREISIRKVLGASVGSIIGMLSKDFLKLVFIAALLAFPLAWWGMNRWLQDFAYRIDLSWWVFAMAAIAAALIAVLTISFQAIKAAITNPVKSLRAE